MWQAFEVKQSTTLLEEPMYLNQEWDNVTILAILSLFMLWCLSSTVFSPQPADCEWWPIKKAIESSGVKGMLHYTSPNLIEVISLNPSLNLATRASNGLNKMLHMNGDSRVCNDSL